MEQFQSRISPVEPIMDEETEQLVSLGQRRLREDGIKLSEINLPGEKLDFIKEKVVALAEIMSRLDPEYFKSNPDEFSHLAELAEQYMLVVEALLVDFEAKVETDYNPQTWWTLILLFLIAPFYPRANTIRAGIKKMKHRRRAFLAAREQYQEIIDNHRDKIYKIVNADLLQEQQLLLAGDEDYYAKRLELNRLNSFPTTDNRPKRDKLIGEIKMIKGHFLILAKDNLARKNSANSNNNLSGGAGRKK